MFCKAVKVVLSIFFFIVVKGAYYEEQAEIYRGDHGLWTAGYNEYFAGRTKEQIKRIMGTRLGRRIGAPRRDVEGNFDGVPNFQSSENWPACASTINFIKDQADCGSCWAVSASSVIADRTCIANQNAIRHYDRLNEDPTPVDISAEELMSCCDWCGDGCDGGFPIDAMRFWCWKGLVTGGWYGSKCGCQPYTMPPCGTKGCKGPIENTPKCSKDCQSGYPRHFKDDKHFCKDHYEISNGEKGIMNEIGNRGPVECAYTVYENFMNYKSGIYDKTEGDDLGGHAVTVVGWGTANNGTKYWIIHNSWNVTWGMEGVFYMKRGVDLAGIESQCVAGKAKTGDSQIQLTCV